MSWRDNLKGASYRGISFHYLSVEDSGGRRLVQHLFPGRDKPEYDDLGAAPDTVSIDAYLLGRDFHRQLQALLSVLRRKGAGTLVHPHFGRRQVRVQSWRVRHTTREGGIARLTIQFVPAGEVRYPEAALDSQRQSEAAANVVMLVAQREFEQSFSIDNAPEFVFSDALEKIDQLAAKTDAVRAKLASINTAINEVTSPITAFTQALGRLSDEAAQLIRQPSELVAQLQGAYVAVAKGIPNSISTALSFYTGFVDQGYTSISGLTPSRQRIEDNNTALIKLQQASAVAAAVQATSVASYESQQQAQSILEQVSALIDLVESDASDEVFIALRDLRSAMVEDIRQRGASLSRIREYVPIETTPALVIAHDLYGDANREAELLNRNSTISNPNFVAGGDALEVLSA